MSKQIYLVEGETQPFLVQLEVDGDPLSITGSATVNAYLRKHEQEVNLSGARSVVTAGGLVSCSSSTAGADWANGIVAIAYASNAVLPEGLYDLVIQVTQSGKLEHFYLSDAVSVFQKAVFA